MGMTFTLGAGAEHPQVRLDAAHAALALRARDRAPIKRHPIGWRRSGAQSDERRKRT